MSNRFTIQMNYDQIDDIVISVLKDIYTDFENMIANAKSQEGYLRFKFNAKEDPDGSKDLKALKKHRKAAKILLSYYGVEKDEI